MPQRPRAPHPLLLYQGTSKRATTTAVSPVSVLDSALPERARSPLPQASQADQNANGPRRQSLPSARTDNLTEDPLSDAIQSLSFLPDIYLLRCVLQSQQNFDVLSSPPTGSQLLSPSPLLPLSQESASLSTPSSDDLVNDDDNDDDNSFLSQLHELELFCHRLLTQEDGSFGEFMEEDDDTWQDMWLVTGEPRQRPTPPPSPPPP